MFNLAQFKFQTRNKILSEKVRTAAYIPPCVAVTFSLRMRKLRTPFQVGLVWRKAVKSYLKTWLHDFRLFYFNYVPTRTSVRSQSPVRKAVN
jgi:hypothetical protein